MAAVSNIPRDVQESIRDVLDKRVKVSVKRLVKYEIRADKMENRVLALSPCRVFLLTAKVPSKMENSFHFLDIQAIESKKPNQLTLIVEGKPFNFLSIEANSDDMDHVITQIGISLKQIFASFPIERLIVKVDVQPADRLKTMNDMIKSSEKKELAPCGGFTTMYQCMCDYHGFPFREEVAWDVDTIYLSHDSRELRLQDFDHLNGKDLVPIIGALEHNTWFKRINASNVKLTVEVCNEIIKVMKRNAVLEEVNLSNTGIKGEFLQKFALAIISNSGSQLTGLDLSNNFLEDKAISHLLGTVKLLPCGLTSFDVSKTGITTRCLNRIGEVFSQSPNLLATLSTLKMNDNGLKGDDFPMLYNCLAQQNAITYLDLSGTDCALDALCDPLLRGCPNLVTLKASRTVFTHKKNKDINVPLSWKQLFSSMCCLEHLDLSSCRLPAEALKDLLLGLSCNRHIKGIFIDLNSNEFGTPGANVLASCISTVVPIKGLDISNNGFDIDLKILFPEIARNSNLRHLSIGRNFANIKPKLMPEVMDALTLMLQEETFALESLSLAESKLKADTTYIINAFGSNHSLQEVDISGNLIGDLGARLLAKALLINTKLSKVVWDKNNVSAQGFEDVAEALQKNMTLRKMPYPVNDAAAALRLYPERTEIALQKIESYLQRNHSPRRFASDNAYRLQQGFLISSTQQMVDRLVVQVQDTVNALRSLGTMEVYADDLETADKLVADANNCRQLFPGLQDIAIQSQVKGNPVDQQLQEMAHSLRGIIEEQMKTTTDEMLKCTLNSCPAVMTNPTSIKEGCLPKSTLPKDFTQGVLEGANTDIYNMTSERNLENAAFISDSVIEAVIDSLTSCHKGLTGHLNLRRSGHYKEQEQDKFEDVDETPKSKNAEEVSSKIVSKRKSLLCRKTRPQSTVVHDRMMSETNEDESTLQTSVYQRSAFWTGEDAPTTICKSVVDKSSLQNLEEAGTESQLIGSTEQLNDFVDLPASPSRPLEHVTKGRPRREKMHRPTRPIIDAGSTEMEKDLSNDPQPAYQTQTSLSVERKDVKKEVKDDISGTSQKPESMKVKQDDATSKKWIPGFMKKSKEEKQDKESKDAKKSSFSTSFSNIFKKKDEKRRPSASDATDNKVDLSSLNTPQAADQGEAKIAESLEIVKATEIVGDSVKMADAAFDLENPGDKFLPTSKSPKEKRSIERVAILPPLKKSEARVSTLLATAEDTNLEDMNNEPKELPAAVAAAPNGAEQNKDEILRLPAGLAKTPALGVLGGKNLLQEMKLKQEKRFSRSPVLGEDEKDPTKAKAVKETGKTNGDNQKEQEVEATYDNVKKGSPSRKQFEPCEPKLPVDDPTKKDLNDNTTTDSSPSSVSTKPAFSSNLSKVPPIHAPRTVLHPRRPISTVEDCGPPEEPPQSMTISTPEVLLGDSSGTKSRPLPPVKPRPPIMPRSKKRDSDKDFDTEDTLASDSVPPTPTGAHMTEVPSIELRSKPSVQEEGIVTDSATLRLSVKDKIKRLSQAKGVSDIQSHIAPPVRQKIVSQYRESKLPENMAEESHVNGKMDSNKNVTQTSEESNTSLEEKVNLISNEKPDSSHHGKTDDEIMV